MVDKIRGGVDGTTRKNCCSSGLGLTYLKELDEVHDTIRDSNDEIRGGDLGFVN